MKLSENLARPIMQPIGMYLEAIRKKKMDIILTTLFLLGSFFLAQAVLFDAAVPFFLPIWALARARFRKYLIFVFIGGLAGSMFLGVGQAVIHLLQLGLFNAIIRYPFAKKLVHFTVASCVLVVQVVWQLVMHVGILPIDVQFFIGFEVILLVYDVFHVYCISASRSHLFW